jgi:hypothetical protein
MLRRGAQVILDDNGLSIGRGTISEVSRDEVHGEGLWRMAAGVPALDGSSNPTTVPNTAIDQALARGDLPGWIARITFNRPSALATTAPTETLTLAELLQRDADSVSFVPWISSSGEISHRAIPTTPLYQTTLPDGQLTTASDDYVTHLIATYFTTSFVNATRTYPSTATTAESDQWGKVTKTVDLRSLGVITTGTVDAILAGMLAKGMARPTWAGTLDVTAAELTTLGGSPSYLPAISAGDGIRLNGVYNDSRVLGGYTSTDITAGRVEYTDGAATARITPVGFTPRDFEAIWAKTISAGV